MFDVIETTGRCRACGKKGILGDGLCMECWDNGGKIKFTKRECEVLTLIVQGANNGTIKNMMYLSLKTVERHINSLFSKVYIPNWADKRVWLAINAARFLEGNNDNGQHRPAA